MIYSASTIVDYSREQIFQLVNDIESYPKYVKFCRDARLENLYDNGYDATLQFQIGHFSKSFTTRNVVTPHSEIKMKLISGPFNRLDGRWSFDKISATKCRVKLEIDYEFSSRLTAAGLHPFFRTLPKLMIESFCSEARRQFSHR